MWKNLSDINLLFIKVPTFQSKGRYEVEWILELLFEESIKADSVICYKKLTLSLRSKLAIVAMFELRDLI